jgi:hypothetical protein
LKEFFRQLVFALFHTLKALAKTAEHIPKQQQQCRNRFTQFRAAREPFIWRNRRVLPFRMAKRHAQKTKHVAFTDLVIYNIRARRTFTPRARCDATMENKPIYNIIICLDFKMAKVL